MENRRRFLKQAGLAALTACSQHASHAEASDAIVIENAEARLVLSASGTAESLIHKASGQECLGHASAVPMFTVTQYRPYDNELQLSYPAKPKVFPSERVRREGDRLIVSFAMVGYEATIRLKITNGYLAFTLDKLEYKERAGLRPKPKTPIDETVFLQLPVRNRQNFGDWLNVAWDDALAVNLLATDPFARIDCSACGAYRLMQAGTVDSVKTQGVGAALIVTEPRHLLDRIATIETDYGLPLGVAARRRKEYSQSYYELITAKPEELDRHLRFAQMAGLTAMDVYYAVFCKTAGHFSWRPEYPRGIEDVKSLVDRIAAAGITPGIHIHYNKANKDDAYVTPRPDPRLNLTANFTLKESLDERGSTITVEESPRQCPMEEGRRILRVQGELITYQRYTTTPPYQFIGCQRGSLGTRTAAYASGQRVGLLDVDTWPIFVRLTQNTDVQEEVARRIADIYHGAGFRFVYFDGAEDVPGPEYWYTVSRAQWLVYQKLDPPPLIAEGACKSHFSWHVLSRGNAFDVFKPEVLKESVRAFPAAEAPQVAKDFTSINFGWIGYWAPSRDTVGTQPDMLEYATSRAAAWDCPISLVGDLPQLEAHPRTPDNLEVIRRWEEVRSKGWLTAAQKSQMRDLSQEHTLLIDERRNFELAPYSQIEKVAGQDGPARAFVFQRNGRVYVAFWHTSGQGSLQLTLDRRQTKLMAQLGKPIDMVASGNGIRVPLAGRHYLECVDVSRETVVVAFQKATLL